MKRFLSIMLTVMLILSSFVMVSADDSFSVIEVTETASASHLLGTTYEGYYEISADIYVTADVTKASISAASNEDAVATKEITSLTPNTWETVKVNVLGDSFNKVNFAVEGGSMYVKAISFAQIYTQNLVWSEDFTGEEAGAAVSTNGWISRYTSVSGNKEPVEEGEKTTFTVVENIGGSDKVAHLYKPTAAKSGTSDSSGGTFTYIDSKQKQDNYYIDIPAVGDADHIKVEFDAYNPGHRRNQGNPVDTLDFAVARDTATVVWANQVPRAELSASDVKTVSNTTSDHKAGTIAWNKVVYEAKRYQNDSNQWCVDYSVTYGGVTATETLTGAQVDNFKRLLFGVNYNYGGGFYIDNIKVYTLDDAVENVYYTEDFTGKTSVGYEWESRYKTSSGTKLPIEAEEEKTKFTVASNIGGSDEVGYLYKPTSTKSGTSDSSGNLIIDTNRKEDNFYIDIPEVGDADYIKLEFDAYNPATRTYGGTSYDTLDFAVARDTEGTVLWANQVPRAELGQNTVKASDSSASHSVGTKAWNKVVYEAKRYQNAESKWCVDYSVTYGGVTAEKTIEGAYVDNFQRLMFGVYYTYGGSFYIDNIKVSSPITTDAQLEALDTYAKEVYSVKADVEEITDAYKVLGGTFSKDAQSITLVKAPGAANEVQVVTAIYKAGVLQNAEINGLTTTDYPLFQGYAVNLENKVELPETISGETFKVFVFDTAVGLRPLADMLGGTVTAAE